MRSFARGGYIEKKSTMLYFIIGVHDDWML
ncbi:Protein of unknown function [Bacillus mycoides]|nr:Protein of unknown function [Bacillus mycoides]